MINRRVLLGGLGLGAAVAGGALAWHQAHVATLSPAAQAFWAGSFDNLKQPGKQLTAASLRGQPLLLNFWASWCGPCVSELPLLDRFAQEMRPRGWRVLGLAVDQADAAQAFLAKMPLSFDLGLAGLTGLDLTRTLGNLQGGLPFSVAFDANGEVIWRKLGATNEAELRALVAQK